MGKFPRSKVVLKKKTNKNIKKIYRQDGVREGRGGAFWSIMGTGSIVLLILSIHFHNLKAKVFKMLPF